MQRIFFDDKTAKEKKKNEKSYGCVKTFLLVSQKVFFNVHEACLSYRQVQFLLSEKPLS